MNGHGLHGLLDVLLRMVLTELQGTAAVGHVRYSTAGESRLANAQPILIECVHGPIAVCHNGNLVNAQELRSDLVREGSIFQTTGDTEVLLHLYARSKAATREQALVDGDCALLTPRIPFCSAGCSSAVCVEDGQCQAYPTAQSVGTVHASGLHTPSGATEFSMDPIANNYQPTETLPYPAFAEGDDLVFAASGSTFTPGRPKGVWTFVRPNTFEAGRANICVYNWDLKDAVDVDVSKILQVGTAYEVRDVQDFFGKPVAAGAYRGGPISVPMKGLPVAAPKGKRPRRRRTPAPNSARSCWCSQSGRSNSSGLSSCFSLCVRGDSIFAPGWSSRFGSPATSSRRC
jgi:hypothetical protein